MRRRNQRQQASKCLASFAALKRPLISRTSGNTSTDDSIDQADAWVDKLDEQLQLLATQPLMGRQRDELAPRVRSLPFGRYIIFYVPLDDGLDVVRVLHSARDIEPGLF